MKRECQKLCCAIILLCKNKRLLARILEDLLSQCFEKQISYPGADKAWQQPPQHFST